MHNATHDHTISDDYSQVKDDSSLHRFRTELPNCILYAQLSPTEFLVYCHVKRIAGDNGKCYMSHKNIAIMAGIGEKTVRRSLEILCRKNEILGIPLIKKTSRIKESGSLDTCLYTIVDLWPINMRMSSQNNFGTVKLTEGVRSKRPKGTVKLTEKEEPIKNINKKEVEEKGKGKPSPKTPPPRPQPILMDENKTHFVISKETIKIMKEAYPELNITETLNDAFKHALLSQEERVCWRRFISDWLKIEMKKKNNRI